MWTASFSSRRRASLRSSSGRRRRSLPHSARTSKAKKRAGRARASVPSSTTSGSVRRQATTSGKPRDRSLPRLPSRRTLFPWRHASTRRPSYFSSKIQPARSKGRAAGVACIHSFGVTGGARLLRPPRRALQQLAQLLLPECRARGSGVAGGLFARRDEQQAAALHPLRLALQHAELRRIALVVRRVDGEHLGLDALQGRRGVVVARGLPQVQLVVRVAPERRAQALVDQLVGLLARRGSLVERLIAAIGADAEE